jgi:hypothetical protein
VVVWTLSLCFFNNHACNWPRWAFNVQMFGPIHVVEFLFPSLFLFFLTHEQLVVLMKRSDGVACSMFKLLTFIVSRHCLVVLAQILCHLIVVCTFGIVLVGRVLCLTCAGFFRAVSLLLQLPKNLSQLGKWVGTFLQNSVSRNSTVFHQGDDV